MLNRKFSASKSPTFHLLNLTKHLEKSNPIKSQGKLKHGGWKIGGLSDGRIQYGHKKRAKKTNRVWFLFYPIGTSTLPHIPRGLPIFDLLLYRFDRIVGRILEKGYSDGLR